MPGRNILEGVIEKMNGDMWGLKRLLLNQDGTWQQLLKNKYLGSKSLTQAVRKSGDSHFWAGLMNIKEEFLGPAIYIFFLRDVQ
ncbi:hypothetical protein ACJX0J_019927, partial [Zea mays]